MGLTSGEERGEPRGRFASMGGHGLSLILAAALGCGRQHPSRVSSLLDSTGDAARAPAALEQLGKLKQEGLTAGERKEIIGRAALARDSAARLLGLLRETAREEDVAPIEAVYQRLPRDAKVEAIDLLSRIPARSGAESVVRLLAHSEPLPLRLGWLARNPRYQEVYFPALLARAEGEAEAPILAVYLEWPQSDSPALRALAPRMIERYRVTATAWEKALAAHDQEHAASLADLMGYELDALGSIRTDEARAELTRSLAIPDAGVRFFAAMALLAQGARVPANVLDGFGADPNLRVNLFDRLKSLGRLDLFPARFRNQSALAEGVMVRWLVYPTELGRPPDRIELMKVVSDQVAGEGLYDWYLYRFKSGEKDWMAGVAGPFRRADEPTAVDLGGTFSDFEPWSKSTPDEHVARVRALIEHWKAEAAKAR